MFKKPLFWEMFVLIVIVGVLNFIATAFHLYWSINEFDSLMHFLGGAMISIFFLWFYFFSDFFSPQKRTLVRFLLVSILGTLLAAMLWEIYELVLGEAVIQKTEYSFDTTLDFIMGLLGATAASFYGYMKEYDKS